MMEITETSSPSIPVPHTYQMSLYCDKKLPPVGIRTSNLWSNENGIETKGTSDKGEAVPSFMILSEENGVYWVLGDIEMPQPLRHKSDKNRYSLSHKGSQRFVHSFSQDYSIAY